jgi:acyl dehydratase
MSERVQFRTSVDTLSVVSEIVEITPSRSQPNRGSVRVCSETRNQHGEVVQTFTARLVVPRQIGSTSGDAAVDPGP